MELREKLARLKGGAGLTTEKLSALSGVPRGTINKLLNGETKNPTFQTLSRLAKALSCPTEMLTGDVPALPEDENILSVTTRRVPLLGEIAAGVPIECRQEEEVLTCDESIPCDFALRVRGDSMIGARILDGDIVFIRQQDDVDDGTIAAVWIDGDTTLKRVYHIRDGVQLISENPRYAPMIFSYPDCERIRILGRAVGFQSRIL
ncbi:MAG: helix-turn-helix domain-containing protein [Clostridia bacterium]|nr:helix-turn-helix domain-containing protein [Clostridia bacterium]